MKALLEKIRKILRSRRTRQMMTRFVSGIAAVVVFVTTYALVLPAITLEQNASCGIPEHQHTDACYEERLVCGLPEGEGHHHDASCYDKILICGQEVHVHSPECYQEDSSAVVSSGSAAAASTAFDAAADSAVLYGTDGSENDDEALVTDSYTAGEDAGEEGVEETAETAAEEFAAEESASDQAVGESGTDNTAAEGSNSGESDAEEADEKRDTAAGEYGKGEAAPEESAQDGSDSGIADPEGLKDSEDRNSEESKTSDTTDSKEAVNGSASDTSDAENEDVAASGTEEAANEATTNVLPEPVETENLSEGYVPELDSIELGSVLNKYTDFYYFHPEQGQEIPETSAEVTDWKKVKNGLFGSTKLESTDLVKMYLSYTIPAGTLNETNQVVRYRLPSNIHLTDDQIIAINETENGMSALYADAASGTGEQAQDENQTEDENAAGYQKYLGAEAIEGTRRPDQKLKEGAQEYISAIVKAENVFDDEGIYGEKGAFLGQDLIFIFTPYSIEKNQTTYTADGNPVSAGEKITGWFACDFNMDQIDWVEQDTDLDNSTVEKTAEITFVEKDSEENIREISRTLKLVDRSEDESNAAAGETAGDAKTAASAETAAAAETASAADTSAIAETAGTADTASEKASEDKAAGAEDKEDAEDGPFKAGTLTADGDGYRITLDYTEKAEIPENAELSVREITAETDKEAYETCLEQAGQQVAADEKTGVDRKASRFFDIEILVRDTDREGKEETRKIEPAAPVSVNIQIIDDQAAEDSGSENKKSSQNEPAVIHFAEEGVEQIDAEVKDSREQKGDEDKSTGEESEPASPATEISFEAESFSIYGVVYTVDFHYEINGEMIEFSIPGGGFVSLEHVVEVLGIASSDENAENGTENAENANENGFNEDVEESEINSNTNTDFTLGDVEISDATKKFVADVERVEFSSPELVWVGKVDVDTTVGALKEANALECEYSAELTEEQIEKINAQETKAGDWALISIQPFDTEESLVITMKNGEVFTIRVTDDNDPLGLNGRTFAIVNQRDGNGNWYALQASVQTTQGNNRGYYFNGLQVNHTVSDGVEYCDQEAAAWKFEYVASKQAYYISNNGRYLFIDPAVQNKTTDMPNGGTTNNHALNLVNGKNDGTLIKITRDDSGNYHLANEKGLELWNYGNGSFWLSTQAEEGNDANGYMHLCLPEDPSGSHKASLTAAKDLSIGQSVIIYQKAWNSTKDAYDFYAIDGNGDLQAVWESSDSLYWKEDISIEWELREELDASRNPTGYLQLYNKTTGKYLAPKSDGSGYSVVHDAASLSEADMKKIRVSLPGRDAGEYSSRIATWDYDDNTTYGLDLHYDPSNAENPYTLEVKELIQSRDFMFAVRDPVIQKQLTTVDTVDSVAKGIKITMYDFTGTTGGGRWYNEDAGEYQTSNERLRHMVNVLGDGDWRSGYYTPGLVNRVLGDDGYPTAVRTNNRSLADIFEDKNNNGVDFSLQREPVEANHLFLQSIYDTTGYYYYSGFNNFARLDGNDFIVYEQLGTPRNAGMNADGTPANPGNFFYYRGNFLPFNELDLTNQVVNYYEGGDQAIVLDDGDPRKSEDLYKVKNDPDYYFGMTMEAKFQQGPNGLSDQGDPMVFEFTGDDDMWIFVDNVLLMDLGGVHDAFFGKINYQTGKITINIQSTPNGEAVTYIKEQYWQAHQFPDGSPWTDRNDPKQNEFFTNGGEDTGNLNAQGQPKLKGTYLDYSSHDLKMFYMERGAGASNLEIQFNIPVITGDEFRVTKNMLTTVNGQPIQNGYEDSAFYYEAYIKENSNWVKYSKNDFPAGKTAVYDGDNQTPVVWKEGSDTVFEVKPGQTAIIPVTDSSVEYKVVEVEPEPGVSHMLDLFNVSNSDEDPDDPTSTTGKTVKRRSQVFFDNKPVDEIVNDLRITKNLHGNLYRDSDTASGFVEDQNGSPYFEIRIFLEATSGKLVPYSLGEYYQIDGETGKYVYYDKGKRKYAETVVEDGVTKYVYTYENGTTDKVTKPKITEHTSQNGSLGDFRPGDTIIIKGLLEGTDFVVDERLDRTHMRQKTEGGWEEEWDNKYYFSHTDVNGAMERNSDGTPTAETKPDNYEIAGTLYDKPVNANDLSVSGNEARGTIVTGRDAEVTVHNEVYNKFELPIQKKWSEDFNLDELDENAKVTFTLKRYKLAKRTGSFTLNANVSGQHSGFDPVYIFTNTETDERFVVKYSEMTAGASGQNVRSRTFDLPVGTYSVTRGDDPAGYDADHSQTANTVTVTSNDEQESGAVASPASITVNSSYTRQSGDIRVTKNLEGYHGNSSYENFTATYSVTDMIGKPVKDINGNNVAFVTLQYSDFSNNSKTITFKDLPSGQYIVKETIGSSSYDNSKYTVVNTANPENGMVTVAKDSPAQVIFTSTYTEVKSNPVRIYVHETAYNRNVTLYDDSSSFRPGDQVLITFMRESNNNQIRYRVNNGDWIQLTDVSASQGYQNVVEEIRMTVPESGITVEIQDQWSQIKEDDVSVVKSQNRSAAPLTAQAAGGNNTMNALRAPKAAARNLRGAGTTDVGPVNNTAQLPQPSDPGQRYNPDSWQLVVTMKNGGDLLDSEGTQIGTFTVQDGKWTVNLKGTDFDGLTAKDVNGYLYYYYIDSISETDVPDGTTPSIDTDTIENKEYKQLYSQDDADTDKKLSAMNELILADKEITIIKVTKGTQTPLPGAKFTLTLVNDDGNEISGDNAYSSGEVEVDPVTGTIRFTGLRVGRYKLEETGIPEGYVAKEGPYYFRITKDGTLLDKTVPHTLISPESGTEYIIENEPGAALPNTGGPGTRIFTILGTILIAGAGMLLLNRRRTIN